MKEVDFHLDCPSVSDVENKAWSKNLGMKAKDAAPWVYGLSMFLSNLVLGWIVVEFLRRYSRAEREKVEGPAKPAMEAAGH